MVGIVPLLSSLARDGSKLEDLSYQPTLMDPDSDPGRLRVGRRSAKKSGSLGQQGPLQKKYEE